MRLYHVHGACLSSYKAFFSFRTLSSFPSWMNPCGSIVVKLQVSYISANALTLPGVDSGLDSSCTKGNLVDGEVGVAGLVSPWRSLVAQEKFAEPKEVEKVVITPVKKELGLAFKGNQKMVVEALETMNEKEAMGMKAALESKGEAEFEVCTLDNPKVLIKKNMVSISKEIKKEHQRVFTPSVIEPSFGIGRIIYCLYEHSFYMRPSKAGDEQLNVFRFPPLVAPIKCIVFPLVQNQKYEEVAKKISKSLTAAGISNKKDITGTSIGKRYARTDELGVPFAVTVDSTTSVTIRERDTKEQVRVNVDEVAAVVKDVSEGRITWADVLQKYPAHVSASADE
ncbi:glycine--tRNA ligase, mitochondrial 1-like [Rutidosis leptorrhynchoides]|uniref:glycine--tRNA ligase, mitochondrial 1-like n=1 Tax=Rutidosis leptorrhynchoides TaxID=125765 RepID=UPI003A98F94F